MNVKTCMFSERTKWPLAHNKISQLLEVMGRNDTGFLDLTVSNPTKCQFDFPRDKILSVLSDPAHAVYAPDPQGLLQAREAICDYYGQRGFFCHPDQVFLTASTSEAYSFLFRLLANPSEAIMFPRPSYPLFEFLVDLNDCRMVAYHLSYQYGAWRVDEKVQAQAVEHKARALVVVNPNNPTGSYVKKTEKDFLDQLCMKNNMALICDEVFYDFAFQPDESRADFLNGQNVLTFVMNGVSKVLALPQMKLSWIIINGPRELVGEARQRLEIIADTFLSVNTPAQNALKTWLSLKEEIQTEVMTRIRENYEFLTDYLKESSEIELLKAEGGWYAVLRLKGQISEEDFTLRLLQDDHVLVHPGYFFDFDEESVIVVSLLVAGPPLHEGLDRIVKRLRAMSGR